MKNFSNKNFVINEGLLVRSFRYSSFTVISTYRLLFPAVHVRILIIKRKWLNILSLQQELTGTDTLHRYRHAWAKKWPRNATQTPPCMSQCVTCCRRSGFHSEKCTFRMALKFLPTGYAKLIVLNITWK